MVHGIADGSAIKMPQLLSSFAVAILVVICHNTLARYVAILLDEFIVGLAGGARHTDKIEFNQPRHIPLQSTSGNIRTEFFNLGDMCRIFSHQQSQRLGLALVQAMLLHQHVAALPPRTPSTSLR